jgi:hypothetical protein
VVLELDIADGDGSTRIAASDEEFAMIIDQLNAEAARMITDAAFSRMRATDPPFLLTIPVP